MKALLNAAAATAILAAVAAPNLGLAQAAPGPDAKTQATAAQATGRATTDAPAATQTQGAAWAVKQATAPTAGAPVAASPAPPARVVARGDLVETLRASGQFTAFLKAADATNLTGVLKNNQNLTVFAPTDAAFAALPPGRLDALMADKPQLQKLLTHHIVNARVDSSKFRGAKGPVPSAAGDSIQLDGSGETLRADDAAIVQPDVIASNGVLQVVDRVLTPGAPGASAAAATTSAAPAAATVQAPASDKDAKSAPSGDSDRGKR
ncbi:fasciclin domain-containing protein [Phenylobacterium sp. LjRoot225]|uniref:fasciclin domain-containing protein n=1 Tax=Phenylobacterium sp. LjRoot225 TaxID=3342285 RepID=UPI003ECF417A